MRHAALLFFASLAWAAATPLRAADVPTHDVPGSRDHPVISRFAGSVIGGYQHIDFGAAVLPLGHVDAGRPGGFAKVAQVEGAITRILYVAPAGKTGMEVFSNFEAALAKAGFQTRFACAGDAGEHGCGGMDFAEAVDGPLYDPMGARNLMVETLDSVDGNVRALTAHLERAAGDVDVSLLVGQSDGAPVGVLLQVVDAKPMATGEVTMDAKAMARGLAQDGHIALYGIHFASDSARLQASSDATLAQMAALLKSAPALKAYVVGHTDDSGSLAHNLELSQQRAEAVVKVLTARYGIAPARLAARGLASYAPVATNHDDAGKAKNRRVELVEQ